MDKDNNYYYVYVLELCDKSFYIGFISDLKKRIIDHQKGGTRSTKSKLPCKFIYAELYLNKLDAIKREKFLKGGSGRKFILKHLNNYLTK